MATITKTSYGTYQVQVRKRGHRKLTKTFQTQRDAQRWARAIESQIDSGLFQDHTEAQRTTLAELLARYETEILPGKRDQASVRSTIRRLTRGIGQLALIAVTPAVLSQYRDERLTSIGPQGRRLSPQTARHDLSLLSRVFNTAVKDWGIYLPHGNPVRQVRMPSLPRGRERRPTLEELAHLETDPVVGKLVRLAVDTGMRRGELVNLRWSDVDWERRTILILVTKNGIPRVIPMLDRVRDTLRSIRSELARASNVESTVVGIKLHPVEQNYKVFPVEAHSVSQAFARACKRYGIQGLRFHDLRHEATSRFFEMGLNPMEVATITGHQSLSMLKRYTHIRPETLLAKLTV